MLGEIKSYYNFYESYNQIKIRLLILRKLITFNSVIHVIFQSQSWFYRKSHEELIKELQKNYDCEIHILFLGSAIEIENNGEKSQRSASYSSSSDNEVYFSNDRKYLSGRKNHKGSNLSLNEDGLTSKYSYSDSEQSENKCFVEKRKNLLGLKKKNN